MPYDIDTIRAQFPALDLTAGDYPAAFFDGPGGTQTPQRVLDAVRDYLIHSNANTGGHFITSERNDEMLLNARKTFADFFACDWDEVSFCHNSTTISYKLSHAIARDLQPGDEVILTDMDHEANRGPWEVLAERGIVIKSVRMNPQTCTLDMEHYKELLNEKTKVVAFNYASNAVGTISDAKIIIDLAKQVGAITIADAVHFALHGVIDVKAIGVDFLFCSAYKFFGPHIGILYSRREAMENLKTLRVSAQKPHPPDKFETGTLNHEGIAGAAEAVEFIADIGTQVVGGASNRRERIVAGMTAIDDYEMPLADYFKEQLRAIDGVTLYGPPSGHPCTSTIALRIDGIAPGDVTTALGEKGIFTWNGSFYAVKLVKTLGLTESGGLVRIGLAPYNTREEIDRALEEINRIASR